MQLFPFFFQFGDPVFKLSDLLCVRGEFFGERAQFGTDKIACGNFV